MVKALRVIQTRIEDTIISFYQNLEERDRMKVIFTLPQLRNHSYISAVNRSVHFKVSQFNSNSVNKSIVQSNNKSISSISSLGKNSSNDFSHVRMSSPNKEEANVPDFNPPLDKIVSSVPYVPLVKSVSFAPSVPIVSSATSVPLVKSVPSVPSVPLVTSVPSAQNVPLVTSVLSAQNVKPKIRTYADVVSSKVNQNDLSNRYNTKTGNNNGISSH